MVDHIDQFKITHLITDLDTGGAEMMLARLVTHMDSKQFTNTVISLTDLGTLGEQIAALGVPVFALGMRPGVPDPRGLARLANLLRREKPDILQTWLYHADLLGTIASRLTHVPVLYWNIRCSDMDMRRYSKLSLLVLRILARLSRWPNGVIVNSLAGKQLHESLGYRPRRWEIIPNGFDLERFHPDPATRQSVREELSIPLNMLLIGLAARYDPMKDHRTFLAAAGQISRERHDVHFILAGRGVEQLSGVVDDLGLDEHVHLLGERADIPRILAALDIFSLSSAFGEGFPNVIGEAMACGVPCVVTDVGDAASIVGDAGRVVPPGDPIRLADAWRQLLAMPEPERQALGQSARRRVEALFSIQSVARRYESLYRAIGKERQSG
ncbi:MAG: glycosyltransferase [Anaerolineae bacterium]|nr:glycosyltransferase [Anaerolineae bacterium]